MIQVRIVRVPFLVPTWAAAQVLLPRMVLVRRGVNLTPHLLAHELAHVDQIQRYGLLGYWARYLWLLAGHGYHGHAMEAEANAYAATAAGTDRAAALLEARQQP